MSDFHPCLRSEASQNHYFSLNPSNQTTRVSQLRRVLTVTSLQKWWHTHALLAKIHVKFADVKFPFTIQAFSYTDCVSAVSGTLATGQRGQEDIQQKSLSQRMSGKIFTALRGEHSLHRKTALSGSKVCNSTVSFLH